MLLKNIKKKKVKKIRNHGHWYENTPDYHIDGLAEDTIIDLQNGGLDDVGEFNCSMYNFGEVENLPDSDRAMFPTDQTCRDHRPTSRVKNPTA